MHSMNKIYGMYTVASGRCKGKEKRYSQYRGNIKFDHEVHWNVQDVLLSPILINDKTMSSFWQTRPLANNKQLAIANVSFVPSFSMLHADFQCVTLKNREWPA